MMNCRWIAVCSVSAAVALTGCGSDQSSVPSPDRSAVGSQISAAPSAGVTVAASQPEEIELRSAEGVTFLSSPMHPGGVVRGGASGQTLNPPDALPAWWAESGLPGTDTANTVVVVGHNYSKREAPFKSLRVVQPGDEVALRTSAGVLDYTVQTVGPLPKGSLLGENDLRESVPGRLILANCDVQNGEPTDDNFIVVAQLNS